MANKDLKFLKGESYADVVKRMIDKELSQSPKQKRENYIKASKKGFVKCPNTAWHHLGTTCEVCGQRG